MRAVGLGTVGTRRGVGRPSRSAVTAALLIGGTGWPGIVRASSPPEAKSESAPFRSSRTLLRHCDLLASALPLPLRPASGLCHLLAYATAPAGVDVARKAAGPRNRGPPELRCSPDGDAMPPDA